MRFALVLLAAAAAHAQQSTAPMFVVSYALQTNQDVVPVQTGGTIGFPPTLLNTTAQAA